MAWKEESRLVLDKEKAIKLLKNLDRDMLLKLGTPPSEKFKAYVIGGAAMMMHDCLSKSTYDIDIIEVSTPVKKYISEYGDGVINYKAESCLFHFPFYFTDRAKLLPLDTKVVDFYLVALEDVLIAKLATTRTKDFKDLRAPDVVAKIDWEKMDIQVEEQAENALNATHASIIRAQYRDYKKDVGKAYSEYGAEL